MSQFDFGNLGGMLQMAQQRMAQFKENAKNVRAEGAQQFGESDCLKGELGVFRATDLMTLVLAHAGRLQKYGA